MRMIFGKTPLKVYSNLNRTSSSQSPPNFPHDKVDIGQEVKADPEEKLQATSAETVRRLGAVPDRQQKRFRTT